MSKSQRIPDKYWMTNLAEPILDFKDGNTKWEVNERLHRTDGPAIERANGDKQYWVNGIRHRADGPALEFTSGYKAWYLHGICYESINKYCKAVKMTPEETTIFLLKWS